MSGSKSMVSIRRLPTLRIAGMRIINKCCIVCLLLLFGSSFGFAQSSTHRCEVSVTDFNTDDLTKLGSFTTSVKEKLITKSFRFLDTQLFATASVLYYKPDSLSAETIPASEIILTLVLSKKAYSAIESEMKGADVITNARATVPWKSFEKANVETIYLGKAQPILITLECKR